ncbi:MAG TPA: YciI family protein [Puia sp.]|nr:YciI family protein [Puia sp.]
MKVIKGHRTLLAEGQRLESAEQPEEAAAVYQQVVDGDPANQEAVDRLLVLYRRAKDYRNELAVIDAALEAIAWRDQSARQKWIDAHPEAARLGKQVLRQLGGEKATGYGTDPMVERLTKRKRFVEGRIEGRKAGKKAGEKAGKNAGENARKNAGKKAGRRKKEPLDGVALNRSEAVEKRRVTAGERRQSAEEKRRRAAGERSEAAAERKRAAAEEKRLQAEAAKAAKAAKAYPPLFVVSLRYFLSPGRIDTLLEKHNAYLDKHINAGDFLVAGRQVPPTGGIIIARGKDREAVERIMKQDPLVKQKLASVDIVEFAAGKTAKGFRL